MYTLDGHVLYVLSKLFCISSSRQGMLRERDFMQSDAIFAAPEE
jgi:hypothetical protein